MIFAFVTETIDVCMDIFHFTAYTMHIFDDLVVWSLAKCTMMAPHSTHRSHVKQSIHICLWHTLWILYSFTNEFLKIAFKIHGNPLSPSLCWELCFNYHLFATFARRNWNSCISRDNCHWDMPSEYVINSINMCFDSSIQNK